MRMCLISSLGCCDGYEIVPDLLCHGATKDHGADDFGGNALEQIRPSRSAVPHVVPHQIRYHRRVSAPLHACVIPQASPYQQGLDLGCCN